MPHVHRADARSELQALLGRLSGTYKLGPLPEKPREEEIPDIPHPDGREAVPLHPDRHRL
jgi:hypothetical protein